MSDPTPTDPAFLVAEPAARIWHFANVAYDTARSELRVDGRPVPIERRPLHLLHVLLLRVDEIVTKDELFEVVWAGRSTVENVLTNAVSKLRTALGREAAARIVTVPRVGYRLLGPVRQFTTEPTDFVAMVGRPVPGADGYVFECLLGPDHPPTVWRARHAKLGLAHVFKIATDGARLAALKREYTLYRVLHQALGPRDDLARVVGARLGAAPSWLQFESGGVSLLDWADRGELIRLNADDRIALFLQIARAVAAVHGVGVLHKDLKPGNVLIEALPGGAPPGWQIRLTDFGSGRLFEPSRLDALRVTAIGLTEARSAITDAHSGTLMYLAPELIAGHPPNKQSDVYSLGVLLFQLVVADLRRPISADWRRHVPDELLADDIAAAADGQSTMRLGDVDELVARLTALPRRRAEAAARRDAMRRLRRAKHDQMRRQIRRPWLYATAAALVAGLCVASVCSGSARTALCSAARQFPLSAE